MVTTTFATKKVAFADNIGGKDAPVALPMTVSDEEFEALWYSNTELDGIMERCQQTIQGQNDDCMRGLETQLVRDRNQSARKAFVLQVLEEQKRRNHAEIWDPDALAAVLQKASEYRRRIPHLQGVRDTTTVQVHATPASKDIMMYKTPIDVIRERHRSTRAKRRMRVATEAA